MRINELLIESQQLDEGPFTQAVGKVGGKIAKGVAGIGKDLKTGFKAGYSGEQPAAPRDPDVPMNPKTGKPLTEPERQAHQDAGGEFDGVTGDPLPLKTDAPKQGIMSKIKQAAQDFKAGYQSSRSAEEPAAPAAKATQTDLAASAPVANPAAEKQSKVGVGQINKIIPTLRTRDLMSLKKNLDAVIASKQKTSAAEPAAPAATPAPDVPDAAAPTEPVKKSRAKKAVAPTQAEIDADRERVMGKFNDSIERHKQRMVAEGLNNGTISIFKK